MYRKWPRSGDTRLASIVTRRLSQSIKGGTGSGGLGQEGADRLSSMSKEELLAAREAKKAQRKLKNKSSCSDSKATSNVESASSSSSHGTSTTAIVAAIAGVGGYMGYTWSTDRERFDRELNFLFYPLKCCKNWMEVQVSEMVKTFKEPVSEKLLPDWPPKGFGIPPEIPVPPTLVLDLDGTLVANSWGRKKGWRTAKRPGVDQFLKEMAQYYEIVIQTDQQVVNAEPIINSLDKQGFVMHRLFRESTHFLNGKHVKDLSKMNRPIQRIIVLDKVCVWPPLESHMIF
jgi:hypothetical protein